MKRQHLLTCWLGRLGAARGSVRRFRRERMFSPAAAVSLALLAASSVSASPANEAERTNIRHMFGIPNLPAKVEDINWQTLPTVPGRTVCVFKGVRDVSGYNHHPSIARFAGRFFVLWNTGFRDEDGSGQKVIYAVSRTGLAWDAPQDLTGRKEGRRFTVVGLWRRENQLFALVSLRDSRDEKGRRLNSASNPLLAYPWDEGKGAFGTPVVLMENFFSNNVPQKTPNGEWMMLGKGVGKEERKMRAARGGEKSLQDWMIADLPPGIRMEEPEWYTLPNNDLIADCRSFLDQTTGASRLIRLLSTNSGRTWSDRTVTDFPEAGSRNYGFRLKSGQYVLLVNPNPYGKRIPLSIALSRDGLVYERIANIRDEPTAPRYAGRAKAPGYSYVRAIEYDENLYIIYSVNKEDIDLSIVPLKSLWPTLGLREP
jgi:hypothetical protein